jgi:hypothetical protein
MPKDLWDLPLSTESPVAAEQYVLAVENRESVSSGRSAAAFHLSDCSITLFVRG